MQVEIWSKDACPYCDMAKNWFKSKNIEYVEHRIGHHGVTREMLLERVPTARTVPQIIIDGRVIGGWTDLQQSDVYKTL